MEVFLIYKEYFLAFFSFIILLFIIKKLFDYSKKENLPYIKKPLLSQNELKFYKKLRPIAQNYDIHILSKIRMADIITVKKGLNKEQWGRYFNKIKAKHVDFALVEPENLDIIALIELDDHSHKRKDRIERDNFIDEVYATVDIPIIHTYGNDIDKLIEILEEIFQKQNI